MSKGYCDAELFKTAISTKIQSHQQQLTSISKLLGRHYYNWNKEGQNQLWVKPEGPTL